ncbi:MAG: hypothetical protein ABI461_05175 [Polyangiaceae bacterium]
MIGEAKAAGVGAPAVLVIYTLGGFNSIFPSFDGLAGTSFGNGMTGKDLGNGLIVDPTYAALDPYALSHMATIGTKHGQSAHDSAEQAGWGDGTNSYMIQLANAIGGQGSIKAAVAGGNMPQGPAPAMNGVSLQQINDLASTISALSGTGDATVPDRAQATKGITSSQAMSKARLAASPRGLVTLGQGYQASIDTLTKPAKLYTLADYTTGTDSYGLGGTTSVNSFKAQMAAAELMIAAGTNVVCAMTGFNWDSHGDKNATNVRNMMGGTIIPPLNQFIKNVMADGGRNSMDDFGRRNVTVVIMGDFARSLPGSDHQPNMSVTVFGNNVKVGTTGKTDANVGLSPSTPTMKGLWAYLAAVSKVTASPFGANPHGLTLA